MYVKTLNSEDSIPNKQTIDNPTWEDIQDAIVQIEADDWSSVILTKDYDDEGIPEEYMGIRRFQNGLYECIIYHPSSDEIDWELYDQSKIEDSTLSSYVDLSKVLKAAEIYTFFGKKDESLDWRDYNSGVKFGEEEMRELDKQLEVDLEDLEQPSSDKNSTQEEDNSLTTHSLQERFETSLPQFQKSAWCEQVNSQYGHFREGTNTGFTILGRKEAIEDIYDHFFPNAIIGFEPEELQQWLSSGYQSHPNYGVAALPPKTISNLRKPDAQDTDAIIVLATQDASVVEQFFCELLGIERGES